MIYNIFGSKDSIDYDIMYVVDHVGTVAESKEKCAKLELEFPHKNKKANVNLCTVDCGIITSVYKGTADECNNSILGTYGFHIAYQQNNLFVTRRVNRNIELKVARAVRIILSFLSRTHYREIIKKGLNGSIQDKITALETIDFLVIKETGKNNQDLIEVYKHIAFQFGQSLGLLKHHYEIYTKEMCYIFFKDLELFLKRLPTNNNILNFYKTELINEIYKLNLDLVKEDA